MTRKCSTVRPFAYRSGCLPLTLGMLCLIFGLLCNEWMYLAFLYHVPGIFAVTRVKLWLCAVCAHLAAVFLLVFRKQLNRVHLKSLFLEKWPRTGALLFGVSLSLLLLLAVEGAFFAINRARAQLPSVEYQANNTLYSLNPVFGRIATPNKRHLEIARYEDRAIFEAFYSIDGFGRRVVPEAPDALDVAKDKFILCFACSLTFGLGVQDDETWPYYLSLGAPGYQVYNYGFNGYGPHQMLRRMEQPQFPEEIAQTEGILIYVFTPHHVRRATGSMRVHSIWGRYAPCYTLNRSGMPVFRGLFPDAKPWLLTWYDLLAREQIIRFAEADIPLHIREDQIELTSKIVLACSYRMWSLYQSEQTYVVIFPPLAAARPLIQPCREAFEDVGFKVLDYSDLFDRQDPEYRFPFELHPTPTAYRALAAKLLEDLPLVPLPPAAWPDE